MILGILLLIISHLVWLWLDVVALKLVVLILIAFSLGAFLGFVVPLAIYLML